MGHRSRRVALATFVAGITYRNERGLNQGVQIVQNGVYVFAVDLLDGKADREKGRVQYTPPLKDHIEYFITLCERWVSTIKPQVGKETT
jgi:hypothetical protein